MSGSEIVLAPLLPVAVVSAIAILGGILIAIGLAKGAAGSWLRALAFAVLIAALVSPQFVRERRQPQSDIAVILVDKSASQNVEGRRQRVEEARQSLADDWKRLQGLEVREVEIRDGGATDQGAGTAEGTRLMSRLRRAVADIPKGRFAGAVVITDGQAHDVSETKPAEGLNAPVHVLLTGAPNESDRRLVVEKSPAYGIVGNRVVIAYRVENRGSNIKAQGNTARIVLRRGDEVISRSNVTVGKSSEIGFVLENAGPSIYELEVESVKGELLVLNNKALIGINGVRDRLRVLLVSGQPHAGERTWRNLLKSDPSVDLVHFTILRPPEKDDFTPLNELALIAFPVRELFEVKLKEFDLIVFDRYVVRDVLPPSYLRNIDQYVREGGALLLSVGPEFSGNRSLFQTPLGDVLPASPTGDVIETGFKPLLSTTGRRHPVTASLSPVPTKDGSPRWGRWFRQIEAQVRAGAVVLEGPGEKPLLVLDRVEKGRVAQMLSDHIWLWGRGFEGGGPQAELLRRLAHWLMKESDLEEESLRANVRSGKLQVERRSLSDAVPEVTVTTPSGRTESFRLEASENGAATLEIAVEEPGLYRITDGSQLTQAASGALNPLEFSDLRATEEILGPVAKATGGGVFWLGDGVPDIRRTRPGRDSSGKGWIGLNDNQAYVVTGVNQASLFSPWVLLVVSMLTLMACWWREGR